MKSYFLQEYEAISCAAKARWAAENGARIISIQHDGVVVQMPAGMDAQWVEREMSTRVARVLGYEQPVEVKAMVEGSAVSGSARLSVQESDAIMLGVGAERGEEARGAGATCSALLTAVERAAQDGSAAALAFDARVVHPADKGQVQWAGWQWCKVAEVQVSEGLQTCKAALWGMLMRARRGYVVLDAGGHRVDEPVRARQQSQQLRQQQQRHHQRRQRAVHRRADNLGGTASGGHGRAGGSAAGVDAAHAQVGGRGAAAPGRQQQRAGGLQEQAAARLRRREPARGQSSASSREDEAPSREMHASIGLGLHAMGTHSPTPPSLLPSSPPLPSGGGGATPPLPLPYGGGAAFCATQADRTAPATQLDLSRQCPSGPVGLVARRPGGAANSESSRTSPVFPAMAHDRPGGAPH